MGQPHPPGTGQPERHWAAEFPKTHSLPGIVVVHSLSQVQLFVAVGGGLGGFPPPLEADAAVKKNDSRGRAECPTLNMPLWHLRDIAYIYKENLRE